MSQEQSVLESKKSESTFDRIYRSYHSNKPRVILTPKENEVRERWEKAWLLLCRHRTSKEVVDLIVRLYNVARSTAFYDVRHSMMLFGNPQQDTKDAKRAIAESMALKGANKCWANGDMDGYHKFQKLYQELNHLHLDKDGGIGDLLKKLKPHQIIIVSTEAELEAQANKLQQDLIRDIEHKVVE